MSQELKQYIAIAKDAVSIGNYKIIDSDNTCYYVSEIHSISISCVKTTKKHVEVKKNLMDI